MRFGVYLPPQAKEEPVPVLFLLAELTCNEETFAIKSGAQRFAAQHGAMLVTPDSSPRSSRTISPTIWRNCKPPAIQMRCKAVLRVACAVQPKLLLSGSSLLLFWWRWWGWWGTCQSERCCGQGEGLHADRGLIQGAILGRM